ncbi:hypothetical protein SARC_10521, partial [Sphaeroforma arctica JP610]
DFTNPSLPIGADFGLHHHPVHGYDNMWLGAGMRVGPSQPCVLQVRNLNTELVTPDILFTLFGVYSDVQRVKILYKQPESALIQIKENMQAYLAMIHLNGVPLFGKDLHIVQSRHPEVRLSSHHTHHHAHSHQRATEMPEKSTEGMPRISGMYSQNSLNDSRFGGLCGGENGGDQAPHQHPDNHKLTPTQAHISAPCSMVTHPHTNEHARARASKQKPFQAYGRSHITAIGTDSSSPTADITPDSALNASLNVGGSWDVTGQFVPNYNQHAHLYAATLDTVTDNGNTAENLKPSGMSTMGSVDVGMGWVESTGTFAPTTKYGRGRGARTREERLHQSKQRTQQMQGNHGIQGQLTGGSSKAQPNGEAHTNVHTPVHHRHEKAQTQPYTSRSDSLQSLPENSRQKQGVLTAADIVAGRGGKGRGESLVKTTVGKGSTSHKSPAKALARGSMGAEESASLKIVTDEMGATGARGIVQTATHTDADTIADVAMLSSGRGCVSTGTANQDYSVVMTTSDLEVGDTSGVESLDKDTKGALANDVPAQATVSGTSAHSLPSMLSSQDGTSKVLSNLKTVHSETESSSAGSELGGADSMATEGECRFHETPTEDSENESGVFGVSNDGSGVVENACQVESESHGAGEAQNLAPRTVSAEGEADALSHDDAATLPNAHETGQTATTTKAAGNAEAAAAADTAQVTMVKAQYVMVADAGGLEVGETLGDARNCHGAKSTSEVVSDEVAGTEKHEDLDRENSNVGVIGHTNSEISEGEKTGTDQSHSQAQMMVPSDTLKRKDTTTGEMGGTSKSDTVVNKENREGIYACSGEGTDTPSGSEADSTTDATMTAAEGSHQSTDSASNTESNSKSRSDGNTPDRSKAKIASMTNSSFTESADDSNAVQSGSNEAAVTAGLEGNVPITSDNTTPDNPAATTTTTTNTHATTNTNTNTRTNTSKRKKRSAKARSQNANNNENALCKDYSKSSLHRFRIIGSKNYGNIAPPSSTLHLSNIPADTPETELKELCSRFGTVIGLRFFPTPRDTERIRLMALVAYTSKGQAVDALVRLHNHQIHDNMHLRVSFSKTAY